MSLLFLKQSRELLGWSDTTESASPPRASLSIYITCAPYDSDGNIGSVPLTTNLDTWDGMRWRFQKIGCHLGIGKLEDGRYYACYSSDWPEGIVRRTNDGSREVLFRCEDDFAPPALSEIISEEEAKRLVLENQESLYEEIFGELPHQD